MVIDGDASWFNNPQFRVQPTGKRGFLYVSVLSSSGLESDGVHVIAITVTSMPKSSTVACHPHLWDASTVEVVTATGGSGGKTETRVKGQEASVWALEVDTHHVYHVVVHTLRRGLEGDC